MKKRILLSIAAVALVSCVVSQLRSEQPNKVGDFMRVKLTHSQKALEGLTTENYQMIAKAARDMSLVSLDSNWQVLQTPEYLDRSKEFRRSCDALIDAADHKNLDGAAFAYMDMTMKCISCHNYVRHDRNRNAK